VRWALQFRGTQCEVSAHPIAPRGTTMSAWRAVSTAEDDAMERILSLLLKFVFGHIINLLVRVVTAVAVTLSMHLLRPIPTGPFLALTPATTAIGRSLTVAPILAGALGLAVLASRSYGTWLLLPAIIVLMIIGVGCSRAFMTLWWPRPWPRCRGWSRGCGA
jgi:hypothetical protein